MELTLASYNIHKGVGTDRRRDPERILAVLKETGAEVAALQECDRRLGPRETVLPRHLVEEAGWQIATVARRPASMGWHGNAVLVARGSRLQVEHARPLELPTLEPRGAVHVRLACDDAMPLDLFGVHLDLSGFRRRAQLRALLAIIADRKAAGPAVMLGDFNQWSRLRGAMRAFPDEWSQCDPGPSFPSRRPIARLDRIVVSGGIDIRSAHAHHSALSVRASDHLPIVARIALPKK